MYDEHRGRGAGRRVSPAARILRAGHTHLYPGARLRAATAALRRGSRVHIEFSDLASAAALIETAGAARATLAVDAYRTARGTVIAAKRWLLERPVGSDTWRVRARVPEQDRR